MAHDGAWPAIRDNGLMSSNAILELYEVDPNRRAELTRVRRPNSVVISRVGLPDAILRDQKPMHDNALEKCLQGGLTPADWYALLNQHSFFWLSTSRIWSLLHARAYRNRPQTVLTVDTASLVARHHEQTKLSPINSGATLYRPQPRGINTFSRIEDFPFEDRQKKRKVENNVVELLVEGAVLDIRDHVRAVHRVQNNEIIEVIWKSPNATEHDHP